MSASFPYRQKLPNGDLRVRRVLPPSLIPIVGSKSITRDLDTKDEQIAKARSFARNAEIQAIIDDAWRQLRGEPEPRYGWPSDPRNPFGSQIRRYPPPEGYMESVGRINDAIMRENAITDCRLRGEPLAAAAASCEALLTEWKKRRSPRKSSIAFFSGKVKALFAWLKHDDITRVTDDDLIKYVGHLIDGGKSQITIKNHLQGIKTMFAFALEMKLIRANPAAHVKFKSKAKKGEGRRDFTPEETLKILTMAREAEPIIRWPNWIAALGGARIEEVARAHKRDVVWIYGVWALRLWEENRPEDEGLKTPQSSRLLPLHSGIIREGFLGYCESTPDGPLFPGNRRGRASQKNSRWLRNTVRITDKRAVFHSHRHTFITASRVKINDHGDLRIPQEARIAITGHADGERRSVHGSYGEWPIATLKALIERIPDPTLATQAEAAE
jgi:integrase